MKPNTQPQSNTLTTSLTAIAIALGFGLSSARAQITPVGGIARDFTITNHMTGQPLRLYDYQGNVILLDFWAYWCTPCQNAAADIGPNIVEYYRNNGGNAHGVPVQVISISIDPDDPVAIDNFIQAYGLELVGDDYSWIAYDQFTLGAIPLIVVINGTTNAPNYQPWQVLYRHAGYNRNAVRAQIDSVQQPPPICTLVTPANGETSCPPVTLTATVTTNGPITHKVEFYHGALLIGSTANAPYNVNWNIVAGGEKTVFARAHYGLGLTTDSEPVTFVVGPAPPGIDVQPTDQIVAQGGSNCFTLSATGTVPVNYQWQKNQIDLPNGGHYSGCTTPTLVIVNCDANDAASYRCVLTNPYGSIISDPAMLTVMITNTPPRILQQPSPRTVMPGGTTSFLIVADGSDPLSYQWQKNNVNLGDGGHYAGATTALLTITGADTNDVADYRCVVASDFGSTNSDTVTLTLASVTGCIEIANADFENGFSLAGGGYIGNHWLEWEGDPGVVTGYDETGIKRGGGHAQRLRLSGRIYGTSGGVYQRVPVTAGLSYTVGVWIYAGDSLISCSLGVDPAGGTNAAGPVTWSTLTTNVAWVEKTVTVTATASYLTIFYKVASSDSVRRNGYFDDATPAGLNGPLELAAQRDGHALNLTWPECPAARLEWVDSLTAPASWTPATNPVSIEGGQKRVTLTPIPQSGTGFFRLVRE